MHFASAMTVRTPRVLLRSSRYVTRTISPGSACNWLSFRLDVSDFPSGTTTAKHAGVNPLVLRRRRTGGLLRGLLLRVRLLPAGVFAGSRSSASASLRSILTSVSVIGSLSIRLKRSIFGPSSVLAFLEAFVLPTALAVSSSISSSVLRRKTSTRAWHRLRLVCQVAVGVVDLDVDRLAEDDPLQGFGKRPVGQRDDGVAHDADGSQHGAVEFLVGRVLVDVGDRHFVVAADFQPAVVLHRFAQPRGNRPQHDPHVAAHREAIDDLLVAGGGSAVHFHPWPRFQRRQVGIFDLDEQPLAGLDLLHLRRRRSASAVPTFSRAEIARL